MHLVAKTEEEQKNESIEQTILKVHEQEIILNVKSMNVRGFKFGWANGCIQRVKSFYWTIFPIARYQLTSLQDLRAPRK